MEKVNATQIDNFLPHMRDVIRCEHSLHELNLMWRIIESSAKMNCPEEAQNLLPSMAKTREGFDALEKELVLSLVNEKVVTALNETATKAQYLIDILVRNLYERTADVGFLATDKALCAFVANPSEDKEKIESRLLAYRRKYTVYDEIILLDTHGNVLAQIDETTSIEGSLDPLIKESLLTKEYVETFRFTDLRPNNKQSLIYSKRMLDTETGAVIGVLCLCFNLTQEMDSIFKSHGDMSGRSIMLLLDDKNYVIESSDANWVSVGTKMPVNEMSQSNLYIYGGREYLVSTLSSEGYQDYLGPLGWKGQVMMPIDIAFTGKETDALTSLEDGVSKGLLSHAQSFCPPLFKVMDAAATIRRVVWNGQVMTAGHGGTLLKLKTILDQISETGTRSNDLFTHSINDLYETVLASNLQNAQFISNLLVDLLDRNLYERANDCRWWALTSELKTALAFDKIDASTALAITDILKYINKLYTVYTRIFVYDRHGVIIASTNASKNGETIIGKKIDSASLSQVMQLRTEQQYVVSPFISDTLYENAPTYIYHAAIRSNDSNAVVGGIGIVFDSTPEFSAMLKDSIPEKSSFSAFYINRQGRIISSTDPTRLVGSMLDISKDLLALPNGANASKVVIYDHHYAIVGCSVSSGYREFKVTDGYQEDVIAVVYDLFGEVQEHFSTRDDATTIINSHPVKSDDPEFATFFIDNELFAIDAANVMEALPATAISTVALGASTERVGIIEMPHESKKKGYAWVFDLAYLLSGKPLAIDNNSQVIIVKCNQLKIGLLVSALHSVAQFSEKDLTNTPLKTMKKQTLIKQIIKANNGDLLIQSIDIDYLLQMLSNPFAPIDSAKLTDDENDDSQQLVRH